MKIVALDPSVHNVGWCLIRPFAAKIQNVWKWGTFHLEGRSLEMKLLDLVQKIDNEIGEFTILLTERPMFFSSERGQIAAHRNFTIDLAAVNYFVAGWYKKDHRNHFAMTANLWKGSVPKDVTARRFFRDFPNIRAARVSEHAIDAMMMSCYWIEAVGKYTYKGRELAAISRVLSQDVRLAAA